MKTMFKKAISVLLVTMLVCSLFTGTIATNVSAEDAVPTFNSATQAQLVKWSGGVNIAKTFYADIDVKDKSTAVYVEYDVTPNASAVADGRPIPAITIASVTYEGKAYDLLLRLSSANGHTLYLSNPDDYYNNPIKTIWENEVYLDGGYNCGTQHTFTVKIEGTSINLWFDGVNVTAGESESGAVWDLTNLAAEGITVNGPKAAAGYNWGNWDYNLDVSAWTAKTNANTTYDVNAHFLLDKFSDTSFKGVLTASVTNYEAKEAGAVYTSFNYTVDSDRGANFNRYVLLAETDFKASATDTSDWYLGIKFTMTNGWNLALYNTEYSEAFQWPIKLNQNYSNGTKTFADTTVATKICDGKASIWLDGKLVESEYTNENFNITKAVFGARTVAGDYKVTNFKAWTKKQEVPVFDAATQDIIAEKSSSGLLSNLEVENFESFAAAKDETDVIYTSFSIDTNTTNTQCNPYILLAETDFKTSASDTATWYLGLHFSMKSGWNLALYQKGWTGSLDCDIKLNQDYSDTTQNFSNGRSVVAKIGDGKASIWLDGQQLLWDYTSEKYNIIKPVFGTRTLGYGYTIKNFKAWTAKDNYKFALPTFDPATQDIIAERSSSGLLANLEVENFESFAAVKDETDVIYTTFSIDTNTTNTQCNPYILLAETDFKTGPSDTATWYLGLHFSMKNGWNLALYQKGWTGSLDCDIKLNQDYSDTTQNFSNGRTVVAKIGDGKASIWLDGKLVIGDYTSEKYNIIKPVFGTRTLGYGYTIKNFKAWTAKDNFKFALPSFDADNQFVIEEMATSGLLSNLEVENFYNITEDLTSDASVYTTFSIDTNTTNTVCQPYILLAETDFKTSASDTATWYLGLHFTMKNGWNLALYQKGYSGSLDCDIKLSQDYSDTTQNFSNGRTVVAKIGDGKASIWLDGKLVIADYTSEKYNIIKPVFGTRTLGFGYTINNFKAWTDNANYGKLGDLNADKKVNILDFIGMNKLAANDANYTAFNNAVKAFNNEGTIGTKELIMMKKYLLGVINTLTVTD